jgi:hypothetical protein
MGPVPITSRRAVPLGSPPPDESNVLPLKVASPATAALQPVLGDNVCAITPS